MVQFLQRQVLVGQSAWKPLGFSTTENWKPVLEMEPRLRVMIRPEDPRAEESPSLQQGKLKSVQPMCQANGFPMKAQSS